MTNSVAWAIFATICLVGAVAALATWRPEEMRDRIADGAVVIMTDSCGNKYAVAHHIGNVYTVKPIK